MNRIISSKKSLFLRAAILTLSASVVAAAQTRENVKPEPQINQKPIAERHRISGMVTMLPENQPIAKAIIEIRNINRQATGARYFTLQTITDEQGRWTLDKLPNNEFLIIVDPPRLPLPVGYKNERMNETDLTMFVSQTREIKMFGADIDNVAIQVIKGGRITGKIIMDTGDPLPENLIVLPEQTAKINRSPVRIAAVQRDGTFVLEGVPTGDILLEAVVFGKPKEYYVKSMTVGGLDFTRQTFRIENNSEVKNVEIIFAKAIEK